MHYSSRLIVNANVGTNKKNRVDNALDLKVRNKIEIIFLSWNMWPYFRPLTYMGGIAGSVLYQDSVKKR